MTLRVAQGLDWMVPDVSPPDDGSHDWVASAGKALTIRDRAGQDYLVTDAGNLPVINEVRGADFLLHVSCPRCRTHCFTWFSRRHDSLVAALKTIRSWPVSPSCDEAVVREVMES